MVAVNGTILLPEIKISIPNFQGIRIEQLSEYVSVEFDSL